MFVNSSCSSKREEVNDGLSFTLTAKVIMEFTVVMNGMKMSKEYIFSFENTVCINNIHLPIA
jgi:hypothetical protein